MLFNTLKTPTQIKSHITTAHHTHPTCAHHNHTQPHPNTQTKQIINTDSQTHTKSQHYQPIHKPHNQLTTTPTSHIQYATTKQMLTTHAQQLTHSTPTQPCNPHHYKTKTNMTKTLLHDPRKTTQQPSTPQTTSTPHPPPKILPTLNQTIHNIKPVLNKLKHTKPNHHKTPFTTNAQSQCLPLTTPQPLSHYPAYSYNNNKPQHTTSIIFYNIQYINKNNHLTHPTNIITKPQYPTP